MGQIPPHWEGLWLQPGGERYNAIRDRSFITWWWWWWFGRGGDYKTVAGGGGGGGDPYIKEGKGAGKAFSYAKQGWGGLTKMFEIVLMCDTSVQAILKGGGGRKRFPSL